MKKLLSLALAAVMLLALLTACGGGNNGPANSGEPNTNTDQTEFNIISGISALSGGYDDNPVLNAMMENVGIKINWETMSDSLGEQVNIRLTGGELPDAVQAVGWSNYDLGRYGRGGTFIDLTPYVNDASIMPNLSAILEKYPQIKAAITQDDGKIYGLPAAEMMGTGATGAADDYSIHSIQQFSMINKGVAGRPGAGSSRDCRGAENRPPGVQGQRHGPQDVRRGRGFHHPHVLWLRSVVLGSEHLLRPLRTDQPV